MTIIVVRSQFFMARKSVIGGLNDPTIVIEQNLYFSLHHHWSGFSTTTTSFSFTVTIRSSPAVYPFSMLQILVPFVRSSVVRGSSTIAFCRILPLYASSFVMLGSSTIVRSSTIIVRFSFVTTVRFSLAMYLFLTPHAPPLPDTHFSVFLIFLFF